MGGAVTPTAAAGGGAADRTDGAAAGGAAGRGVASVGSGQPGRPPAFVGGRLGRGWRRLLFPPGVVAGIGGRRGLSGGGGLVELAVIGVDEGEAGKLLLVDGLHHGLVERRQHGLLRGEVLVKVIGVRPRFLQERIRGNVTEWAFIAKIGWDTYYLRSEGCLDFAFLQSLPVNFLMEEGVNEDRPLAPVTLHTTKSLDWILRHELQARK